MSPTSPGPNNIGAQNYDPITLGLTSHHDATPNWPLLPLGSNIFGPFSNQDPTAWAMPKAEPNALGPTRRPGSTTLGESVSFKI